MFIKGVIEMTILKKLRDYFEKNQVAYEVGFHPEAFTA